MNTSGSEEAKNGAEQNFGHEGVANHRVALIVEAMYAVMTSAGLLERKTAVASSGSPINIREPIASESIAGYLVFKGIDADVVWQSTEGDEAIVESIVRAHPHVIGFSIHSTHMLANTLRLVRKAKAALPDALIVCGGSHATGDPMIIKEPEIDVVVIGEGEETFYQIVRATLEGRSLSSIRGICYKDNGRVKINPFAPRFNYNQPFRALRKKEILQSPNIRAAPLAYPAPPDQTGCAQVSHSRGCIHNCPFCPSKSVFKDGLPVLVEGEETHGSTVQYRDSSDVAAEIVDLEQRFGINTLFFNDLTFNYNPPKVRTLLQALIRAGVRSHWFAYVDATFGNPDDLPGLMREAGCSRIGIGAESFSNKLLHEMKPHNKAEHTSRGIQAADREGILTRVYMMLGHPHEDREMVRQNLEVMLSLPIDQPRLAFVTPFKGTPYYDEVKDRLLTDDPAAYSGDFPVVRNDNISQKEYIKLRDALMVDFFNSDAYQEHVRSKCERFPHLVRSFEYFFKYLADKQLIEARQHAEFLRYFNRPAPEGGTWSETKHLAADPLFS